MEVEAIDRYAQEIVDHSQDQYRVGIDEKKKFLKMLFNIEIV